MSDSRKPISLFTEQLRPKTLDQAIVIPRIKEELSKGLVDNLLFYGPPGTGKCLHYEEEIDLFFPDIEVGRLFCKEYPTYFPMETPQGIYCNQVKIGDVFQFMSMDNDLYECPQYSSVPIMVRVPKICNDNRKILNNDAKYSNILAYVKKKGQMWEYYLEDPESKKLISIKCSANHLIIDENYQTVKISTTSTVLYQDENGKIKVLNLIGEEMIGEMDFYDIAISEPHLYFLSNGIINHNTTLSRIMANGHETLELNASLERGIETIREKVISFASSSSLMGSKNNLKVVLLEECDNLTVDAWASLRSTIERFHKTTRFIGNCNYIEKIPDPIKSRFNCIPLLPQNQEEEDFLIKNYIARIMAILNTLRISYTDQALADFVSKDFPDFRTMLKKLQQMFTRGVTSLDDASSLEEFSTDELFKILISKPDPVANYDYIIREWSSKPEEGVLLIGKEFPKYFIKNMKGKENKLGPIIISIAEHNEQLTRVTDKLITLLSLVYKIQLIVNS